MVSPRQARPRVTDRLRGLFAALAVLAGTLAPHQDVPHRHDASGERMVLAAAASHPSAPTHLDTPTDVVVRTCTACVLERRLHGATLDAPISLVQPELASGVVAAAASPIRAVARYRARPRAPPAV
jgi:hypothetical protein